MVAANGFIGPALPPHWQTPLASEQTETEQSLSPDLRKALVRSSGSQSGSVHSSSEPVFLHTSLQFGGCVDGVDVMFWTAIGCSRLSSALK